MPRILPLIVFLCLAEALCAQEVTLPERGCDSSWCEAVKTVSLTRDGVELSAPVLTLEGESRLHLCFDLLGEEPADLRYRIVHCDKDWHPDLPDPYDYMQGFEEENLSQYESSFTTRQTYFHYFQSLPARGSTFIASGNYMVVVFLQDAPDSVLLTRRFYVVEPLSEVIASRVNPMQGNVKTDQEVDVELWMKEGSGLYANPQWVTVRVQQNQRRDLLRTLPFDGYGNGGQHLLYRWRRENVFPGGNVFRFFDISNLRSSMYNVVSTSLYGGEYYTLLRPLEDRSRKPYIYEKTLNGGMKTNANDRSNPTLMSEYVWVNFSLPMEQPFIDGTVHLVGDLTEWTLDQRSRMEWRPEYKAYTTRLYLKQGYYAYQLLFLPAGEGEATTSRLEGNHAVAPNDYTVLVYYRHPNDRYDRLIAHTLLPRED